jgi:Asp-tRNA(Asn)/Glu-tRNA(Gln) amidotransferase B subunit
MEDWTPYVTKFFVYDFIQLLSEEKKHVNDLSEKQKDDILLLLTLCYAGQVPASRRKPIARDILQGMGLANAIDKNSWDVDERDLALVCQEAIEANAQSVTDYLGGKTQALGRIVGHVRKRLPNALPDAIRTQLETLLIL